MEVTQAVRSGADPIIPETHKPVPLRAKLNNRFYEPIVLLSTLNTRWANHQRLKTADPPLDTVQSLEHEFQSFVNKLSQICDVEVGGKTVTAFVVLQFPSHIEYRFASNQRNEKDLIRVKSFVENLLHTLHEVDDFGSQKLVSHILREILPFSKGRLRAYVKSLKQNITLCINSCASEHKIESASILKELEKLQPVLLLFDEKASDDIFSKHCEDLLNGIDRVYQSEINDLIRTKSNEGKMNESLCWSEFRHAANRLHSYLQATKTLLSTRKRLPELFEDFEVTYVNSSHPARCPLKLKNIRNGLSMMGIIERMTSDPEALEKYRGYAQQLERIGLDEEIKNAEWIKDLRPIVHAEILVLESLVTNGSTISSRFFGGYKYIGCSKPTCRLCDYYFTFHPSGVRVRQTHRNVYPNWRVPDVYDHQRSKTMKKTENLMIKILAKLREDAFRTLINKVPESKKHDSNTEPTHPVDGILTREAEGIDHLARLFQNISVGNSRADSTSIYGTGYSSITDYSFAAEYDDEDKDDGDAEEGGARL